MLNVNDSAAIPAAVKRENNGPAATDSTHVALPGETLVSIAKDYRVPLPELQAANPKILNPEVVYPGDTLTLPPGATPPRHSDVEPREILRALDHMSRPMLDDVLFGGIESGAQLGVYQQQLADYYERRVALATQGLEPPTRSEFADLPASQQQGALERARGAYEDAKPELQRILRDTQVERLQGDTNFQGLSPDAQAVLRDALSTNDPTSPAFATLLLIGRSPGLRHLDAGEQLKFAQLVSAEGRQLGQDGFEFPYDGGVLKFEQPILNAFAQQSGIATDGEPVQDVDVFREFIDDNPTGLGDDFSTRPATPYGISDPVKTNEITLTETGNLPLLTYYLDIGGQTVTVKLPENPPASLNLPTIEQIAQALAALPPESTGLVTDIEVHALPRFDEPDAYMDIDGSKVNVYPNSVPSTTQEVLGGLVHETGHAIDFQNRLGAFESLRWSAAISSDRVDASGYARENLLEDFAETYKLYQSVRGTPAEQEARALMPARFALLDEILAS